MPGSPLATVKKVIREISGRQFVFVVEQPDDDETIDEKLGCVAIREALAKQGLPAIKVYTPEVETD